MSNSNAMFKIPYGLYILTASDNGKDNGCIINTVMQVTSSPNRIAIAVNKANFTHDMIVSSGIFNVSILTQETPMYVFEHFGFQSGKNTDKFANSKTTPFRSSNGVVYVPGYANAVLSAKVIAMADLGSHTVFTAEITETVVLSDAPTLTYDYYQKNIKPKKQKPSAQKSGYVCKICGYVYEGDNLPPDFICPICKHGAEDFEKL